MALFVGACRPGEPVTVKDQIHATFRDLKKIRMMKPGTLYSVMVAGRLEEGTKEKFLRLREPSEIWESRLSSGCGDYSIAFIERMSEYGAATLMIDAAELSQRSLETRFAGHSVVAVRTDEGSGWWLVDPTAREILSKDWDLKSKEFEANGKRFWIGFCGSLQDYPIHSPEGLRDFYDQTLLGLPDDVLLRIDKET